MPKNSVAVEPTMQTISGRFVNLLSPKPDDILITDIAGALSNINRYTGHTVFGGSPVPYSVAQHSVWVAKYLIDHDNDRLTCLAGLLHDAEEAYINDDSWPKKRALQHLAGNHDIIGQLAKPFKEAIALKFGLPWPWPQEVQNSVKAADNVALVTEKRDMMAPADHPAWAGRPGLPEPVAESIKPWPNVVAEAMFMDLYHELSGVRA